MTIVDFKKKSLEKKNKEFQRVTNDLHGISIVDHFTKKKKKKKKEKASWQYDRHCPSELFDQK